MKIDKQQARQRKRYRIRKKISGTSLKPRISVFKSNLYFYAQIIDDSKGMTIASSSSIKMNLKNGANIEAAIKVAKDLATKAKKQNISDVLFDRSGYIFHGKVKKFAETLREEGLKF